MAYNMLPMIVSHCLDDLNIQNCIRNDSSRICSPDPCELTGYDGSLASELEKQSTDVPVCCVHVSGLKEMRNIYMLGHICHHKVCAYMSDHSR